MNKLSKNKKIRRLAESAIMLALSAILAEVAVIKLGFGGSVTLFSQLPVVVISYRYGVKWGILTGFALSCIQLLFGLENFSYVSGIAAYIILLFADYIIAFTSLGLGGLFRGKVKNQAVSLALGGALVSVIRFVCHFVSGVTIWQEYAGDMPVWKYSLTYNGGYMLPELILTVIGALVVGSVFELTAEEIRVRKR